METNLLSVYNCIDGSNDRIRLLGVPEICFWLILFLSVLFPQQQLELATECVSEKDD